MTLETRTYLTTFDHAGDGRRLVGYAAVFDQPAEIIENGRRFTEIIRPGAFARAVASGGDIISTFNHDRNQLLGRTSSGTLRLAEDSHGLRFELDLPDTTLGNDLRTLVSRGDLRGASFTFRPMPGGERWSGSTRELLDLYLAELGPVVQPAYSGTAVGLRSRSLDSMHMALRLMEN